MSPRCVVVVVFDSVRADHVSAYGYSRPTTPTLDRLAERGMLWERMHSASSWTKPSVGSIFTGRLPTEHGALRGLKRGRMREAATTDALEAGLPTLAESFSAAGWRCAAFMNNEQLAPFTGFHRGFHAYVHNGGKADALVSAFDEWMSGDLETPVFAYLHFMETHWPYRPRRRHVAMFGGDRDANPFRDFSARDYAHLRRGLRRGGPPMPEEQRVQMVQMYDGAIRRLDGKLKLVLDALERAGLGDAALLAVTADHGEELMDHGAIGHGHTLYDELTRVPLVLNGPDVSCGVRLESSASQTSVGRTVLDWAGIGGEFAGRSLMHERPDEPVFSELQAGRRFGRAVRRGDWKLVRTVWLDGVAGRNDRPKLEMFHVASDPGEQRNLAGDSRHTEIQEDLERELESRGNPPDTRERELVEVGPEVVTRLRDLGYLD